MTMLTHVPNQFIGRLRNKEDHDLRVCSVLS